MRERGAEGCKKSERMTERRNRPIKSEIDKTRVSEI